MKEELTLSTTLKGIVAPFKSLSPIAIARGLYIFSFLRTCIDPTPLANWYFIENAQLYHLGEEIL